jgi:hypothetical protein
MLQTSEQKSGDFRAEVRRLPGRSPTTSGQKSDDFRAEDRRPSLPVFLCAIRVSAAGGWVERSETQQFERMGVGFRHHLNPIYGLPLDAERLPMHSHAERGNERLATCLDSRFRGNDINNPTQRESIEIITQHGSTQIVGTRAGRE